MGKSYLIFTHFYHHLLSTGVDDAHILKIQLDQRRYEKYQDPDLFLSYVESKIADDTTQKKNKGGVDDTDGIDDVDDARSMNGISDTGSMGDTNSMYYILLDEVQLMKNFESALNTLLSFENVDVYVTGSNSKFLSRDVITEFRGRGDEIHVYPLSFSEFLSVYDGDMYEAFDEYMVYGGMPACVKYTSEQQKALYLKTLFEETYLVDILQRYNFRNTEELSSLLDIIASDIGSLTNPLRIQNTFSSVLSSSISRATINSLRSKSTATAPRPASTTEQKEWLVSSLMKCIYSNTNNKYIIMTTKRIHNPVTGKYYEIRQRSSKAGKKGK